MTNNEPNDAYQPFHVQSDLLKNASHQGTKSGPESGSGKPETSGPNYPFGTWELRDARWLVVGVFAVIYWITQRDVVLRPMTILVLLACLPFRMEGRARELAGVPLTLAAIKLAFQMTPDAGATSGALGLLPEAAKTSLVGLPWVPMYLAICIFYLPKTATVTGTIARVNAIAMLISGLIPGDGYVVVLALIQYTLFIGVLVGLIADHSWNGGTPNGNRLIQTARP